MATLALPLLVAPIRTVLYLTLFHLTTTKFNFVVRTYLNNTFADVSVVSTVYDLQIKMT